MINAREAQAECITLDYGLSGFSRWGESETGFCVCFFFIIRNGGFFVIFEFHQRGVASNAPFQLSNHHSMCISFAVRLLTRPSMKHSPMHTFQAMIECTCGQFK